MSRIELGVVLVFIISQYVAAKPSLPVSDYGEKLGGLVKILHNACTINSGVSEAAIERAKNGDFSNDKKMKRYIMCVWTSTVVKDNGTIDKQLVNEIVPPKVKDTAPQIMEDCFKKMSGIPTLEEKLFEMTRCMYKADPENFIFF